MRQKTKDWLVSVLQVQYEQATDHSSSAEDLLEWCGHIDEVVNTLGIGPLWEDGVTATEAAKAFIDERGMRD